MSRDVVVVGNGPAGVAAAAACAGVGLQVAVLAPDHGSPWTNTYGVWEDELAAAGMGGVLARRWLRPQVGFDAAGVRRVDRPYGLIANERLRELLVARCDAGGVRFLTGRAVEIELDDRGWPLVVGEDGDRLATRVVVDASGHRPVLLRRRPSPPAAFQAAYGIVGRFSSPPIEPGSMMLMDFRAEAFQGLPDQTENPTFLYGMDLGDHRFLVEETSLARRPALSFAALEDRLRRRLAASGARVVEQLEVERVLFPLGGPVPPRDQLVVGFGSAAGMVHPATGFQVGHALIRASALASRLVAALMAPGVSAASVARAGWQAVWPKDLLRQRALHEYGLETLLRLDTAATQQFLSTFFTLPAPAWARYLSGAESVEETARVMGGVFRRVGWPLRTALTRTMFDPHVRRRLMAGWTDRV